MPSQKGGRLTERHTSVQGHEVHEQGSEGGAGLKEAPRYLDLVGSSRPGSQVRLPGRAKGSDSKAHLWKRLTSGLNPKPFTLNKYPG